MSASPDRYPDAKACRTWTKDGKTLYVLLNTWYCGYVRFPKRPVKEDGYRGILCYVPVHGGITYAEEDPDGSMVYGFDCNHADDMEPFLPGDPQNIWTEDTVAEEVEKMALGIEVAADFEVAYLQAKDNQTRAAVLGMYHEVLCDRGVQFDLTDNFGAMLSVLTGTL